MSDLNREIKQMIIDSLDLEDIELEDIEDDAPLFVDGLGLDSIDALEIGLALQKQYGIKLKADSEETRQYFASVNALAKLVESHRTK
ncbi:MULTISPECIES: phosphopantetheine-binding protein [unclassified Methylophaga]|jgi:acyl carrier protein|uniref:phosphopantetheine-binding protein n=1 Tax=unclassified Methylophaga TaxID=2629249 RepID=UPI000C8C48F8|nr:MULTISPECIES: phosphopantetheine-binding protein [unclassified Methylophaga]MAK66143.1 acyl carrier protein [Methylophaga sp.]MAY17339.1 acyl carrier protein [Methylophaga sp.]MBN45769.1 acyl carrier protein [Methylophaga sp.]HCD04817.1 acyl carrier protein [Methylophaga sp.]|tara:strand:- start:31952 stop:32212 length:261 start_codon:yes stop_codon:yes gene_type:complete